MREEKKKKSFVKQIAAGVFPGVKLNYWKNFLSWYSQSRPYKLISSAFKDLAVRKRVGFLF